MDKPKQRLANENPRWTLNILWAVASGVFVALMTTPLGDPHLAGSIAIFVVVFVIVEFGRLLYVRARQDRDGTT
ncbi:hypothetical protein [Sinomonas gamaensis]|uniref:hypothetical protein n=1 Tax=Sinomonas gamaensis TaxID=2565624 RepID=UPI00110999CE|nr:hypothetical protein [Sinomonas gamaensis]